MPRRRDVDEITDAKRTNYIARDAAPTAGFGVRIRSKTVAVAKIGSSPAARNAGA